MSTRLVTVLLLLMVCLSSLNAQVAASAQPVKQGSHMIAVLPFVGDQSVTPEQLNFITGKFAGELISTGAFTVLDRGKMDFILKEQGFQQTGVCNSSECKVQIGQLLGVDFLVAGNMVKFGPEYAFRLEYIDVSTGQLVKSVDISRKGDLYEVYKEICHEGAMKLAQNVQGTSASQLTQTAMPKLESKRPA